MKNAILVKYNKYKAGDKIALLKITKKFFATSPNDEQLILYDRASVYYMLLGLVCGVIIGVLL